MTEGEPTWLRVKEHYLWLLKDLENSEKLDKKPLRLCDLAEMSRKPKSTVRDAVDALEGGRFIKCLKIEETEYYTLANRGEMVLKWSTSKTPGFVPLMDDLQRVAQSLEEMGVLH